MSRAENAPVKVLFYAINGSGLGHLSRLLSIARSARELLHAMRLRADFQFITTSEASHAASDFPVYKIPSKQVVARSDSSNATFAAGAKLLISNVVGGLRPDILVMDTVPTGSFHEFVFVRDFVKKSVFIDRHKDRAVAVDPVNQSHLALYDRILVPDDASHARRYPLAAELKTRRRFVGRIHGFDPAEAMKADDVRRYFDTDARWLIYVSAGGGGDEQAEQDLTTLIESLADNADHFIVAGYGPLFRGRRVYRKNVVPLAECDVSRFFPGIDLAISAAGYNSYEELLAARVPTAFFHQPKGFDRQDERIEIGAAAGWHLRLAGVEPALIRAAAENLKDETRRLAIHSRLAQRGCPRGALRAAVELLDLHSTIGSSAVDRARLFASAVGRMNWHPTENVAFDAACRHAFQWQQSVMTEREREEFLLQLRQAWPPAAADSHPAAGEWIDWGAQLESWRQRLEFNDREFCRFLTACAGQHDDAAASQRKLVRALEELDGSLGDELSGFVRDVTSLTRRGETLGVLDQLADDPPIGGLRDLRKTLPHEDALTASELLRQLNEIRTGETT